ncbi:MAG: S8 family serine peptidase [Rhodobacteraceae bacterium]|nr:S8 family serine peptidase [Paracoccaceae bacterium]
MDLYWKTVHQTHKMNHIADYRLSRNPRQKSEDPDTLWWSVLVDLSEVSIDEFESRARSAFPGTILIPNDYDTQERSEILTNQVVSIFAQRPLLNAINEDAKRFSVDGILLGSVVKPEHLNFDVSSSQCYGRKIPVRKGAVITAVIDDGIAIAHNLFRGGPVSTRIEFANILTISPTGSGKTYGRVFDKEEIDALLEECTTNGFLDEQKFYTRVGLLDAFDKEFSSVALRRSHGTHVMALAAGYSMVKAPNDRPIICALLPSKVTEDSTGQNVLPSLALALKRLQKQAAQFRLPDNSRPPVVVNFSYGNYGGPHDGTSLIDRLLDQYFGPSHREKYDQEMRLVLPAGNANLNRIHAELNFDGKAEKQTQVLNFLALPDDRTSSHVQMWMPYVGDAPIPPLVSVRVTVPSGPQSETVLVSDDTWQSLCDDKGQELARLSYGFEQGETQRGVITFSMNQTASLESSILARAGVWRIEIIPNKIGIDQSINAWVERDETLPGFLPGGRQGYFNNADYVRFDKFGAPLPVDPPHSHSDIRRAGTLSGYACGDAPMVIAAYTESNRLLSDYSAAGPISPPRDALEPNRLGPDAAARADDSPVLTGVLSAGSSSGSLVRMGGTSVAAPHVTRMAVLAISQGEPADRKWLWKTAESNRQGSQASPTRTGGGYVDVKIEFSDQPR